MNIGERLQKVDEFVRSPVSRMTLLGKVASQAAVWSYTAAEKFPQSRELLPGYFDHVGNASASFFVATSAAFAISGVMRRLDDEFGLDQGYRFNASTVVSTVSAGAAETGLIVNQLSESILSVPDPRDLAFGIVGAAIGAVSVNQEKFNP